MPPATRPRPRTCPSRSRTRRSAGLVGAWAFDEGSGTTASDQSGRGNTGTLTNASWITGGKFNSALSFNGTNAWVSVPDSATLDLTTGMTLEAWVQPTVTGSWRTVVMKEQSGNLVYGLYSNTSTNRPRVEIFAGGSLRTLEGPSQLPTGTWSHLAATYDGATLRLFVNGAQVAQLATCGSILASTAPLRIGGNGVWGEYFSGPIDEVRVYNRALSAAEVAADVNRSVTPDVTPPTILARTPAPTSAGINVGTSATARFNELMNAGSITTTTFQLRDAGDVLVPATVAYDAGTSTATLTPQAALQYGATYTATVKGGSGGVADLAGNALAADSTWSFTTEASPPPILVVGSTGNPFGSYLGEILRNEGLDAFTTIDVSFVSPALLAGFDVVVLGDTPLSAAQVTALTGWVNGGGNLVAMRPDKQLAGLLRADRCGHDARQRLPPGRHERHVAGRRHRREHDAVPRRRRPLLAERRHGGGDALLDRDHGDDEPGRDAPIGRIERRPGGGVHLRSRTLRRLHAPGQPGVGEPGARRRGRHPAGRPLLRRARRRRAAGLARHEQDRDPAGRRAAAPAAQPDHDHGPRQDASPALLVPAARREGSGRHERRRPLADAGPGRHGQSLRPLQGAEPGRVRRVRVGVRALELLHLPERDADERAGGELPVRGLRGRRAPARLLLPDDRDHGRRARGVLRHADDPVPDQVHERHASGLEPQPLRLLARLGVEREGRGRARDPDGRQLLPLPRPLDRREARLHERRRLPDALRRPRRHPRRRLPAEHVDDGRVDDLVSDDDRRRC